MKEFPQSMSPSNDDYRIEIKRRLLKKWQSLEDETPEAMQKCKEFLVKTPEDRLRSGGKLKKLKGKHTGILQYDITDEARVWYIVDRKQRIVWIKFVGHHP